MTGLFLKHSVAICASAVLISGCSSIAPPLGSSYTAQQARTDAGYALLFSFSAGTGVHPASGVITDGKKLYGTTIYGGQGTCPTGCGTIYAITTAGKERVIYRFTQATTQGIADGQYPVSELTLADGTLYGTTLGGGLGTGFNCGGRGCGTVFSVSRSGKEIVLHDFGGGFHDGEAPAAPLLNVNDTLYGSTTLGGPWNAGIIFSLSTTGAETVLYDFTGRPKDGSEPSSPLVDVDGTLYGTTKFGGAKNLGTVFSVTTSGAETVLHSFKGGTHDGSLPRSLIDVNGTLFGTTAAGGSSTTCLGGCGTLFEISTTGRERILHSFSKSQGTAPVGLTTAGDMLYGVAYWGGNRGQGTLFESTLEGATRVLHHFGGHSDGKNPVGQPLVVRGTLYGTTWGGGADNKGTVYTFKP
jgi:uncharacterized repeat protein (TIGR03803 family)